MGGSDVPRVANGVFFLIQMRKQLSTAIAKARDALNYVNFFQEHRCTSIVITYQQSG